MPAARRRRDAPDGELLLVGELARRAKVPVATIKHYIRERLIAPVKKTGQTMSWYDPAVVDRIRAIKELQQRQFLPLDVIRKTLDEEPSVVSDDLVAAEAIARVLVRRNARRAYSRDELLARGANAAELDWLAAAGLARPDRDDARYRGDDLALLVTLGEARKVGIAADMLPFEILGQYLTALRTLVEVELRMFRLGVIARAKPNELRRLTTAATRLSERLVVLLRRKLLLPTLHKLIGESESPPPRPRGSRAGRARNRG